MNIPYPKLIAIIRHGEAAQNVIDPDARATVRSGTPNHEYRLTERGQRQALWLRGALAALAPNGFDAVYVSPYRRTWETREIAIPCCPEPVMDARVAERWRGIWHTHGPAWVDERMPWEREAQTREGWYHNRPSGGQSVMDVEAQVASFLTDLRLRHPDERVAVFTHNTTSIAALRHALNLSLDDAYSAYRENRIKNCHVLALAPNQACRRRLELAAELDPPADI